MLYNVNKKATSVIRKFNYIIINIPAPLSLFLCKFRQKLSLIIKKKISEAENPLY